MTNAHRTLCAFEKQLQQEWPSLRRIAAWLTRSPERAEDLLQDTAVLALRFRDSYRADTNLHAWLTRIMRNRHISLMRRRSLEDRTFAAGDSSTLSLWSTSEDTRRAGAGSDAADADDGFSDPVLAALSELRGEFRDVVMLCDVDSLSYAEAAATLGCPLGTIMSRLHRGRKELRRRLVSRDALNSAA